MINTLIFQNNVPKPVPLMAYRATDLDPTITGVNSWENAGSTGAAHNLTLRPNSVAPAYFPSGGYQDKPYVRFSVNDILQTVSNIPESITQRRPRTVLARLFVESGATPTIKNLFGMGSADTYGGCADFTVYPDEFFALHKYYAGVAAARDSLVKGRWVWVGLVFGLPTPGYANPDGVTPSYSQYAFMEGVELERQNKAYDSLNSAPLYVGGGGYQGYNNAGTPFLLDSLYVYGLLTPAQLAEIRK